MAFVCAGRPSEVKGGAREREFVTDVQPFERKLNKYLISKRWAAPVRRALSQAF